MDKTNVGKRKENAMKQPPKATGKLYSLRLSATWELARDRVIKKGLQIVPSGMGVRSWMLFAIVSKEADFCIKQHQYQKV